MSVVYIDVLKDGFVLLSGLLVKYLCDPDDWVVTMCVLVQLSDCIA